MPSNISALTQAQRPVGGISDREFIYKFPQRERQFFTFPSPFFDIASQYMPRNIKDMFRWAEHIYLNNGVVSQCIRRMVMYPLTHLVHDGAVTEVTKRWDDFFSKTINIRSFQINAGVDLYVYGNSFTAIYFPIRRILVCPQCKMHMPVKQVKKVAFKEWKFRGKCKCGYNGPMCHIDRRSQQLEDINLIRLDPKNVDISYNEITGKYKYYYRLPKKLQARITRGDIHAVADMPWDFIEATRKKKVLLFNNDSLYHMKMPSLSGLHLEWGLSPTLQTFKLHYYAAILRRANEAIGLDYLVPIRILYPERGASNDPSQMINLGKHRDFALDMIKKHRQDPGDAYYSPIPVGYQAIGGEAKALNIVQDIKITNEEIMNALGVPQELFYGSLSVQAAPTALRLFENTLSFYVYALNDQLAWITDKIARYTNIEKSIPRWAKVTLVDDMEKKGLLMQMMASQKVADDTFLRLLGTDFKTEMQKLLDQERVKAQLQTEYQKKVTQEQDAAAMSGDQMQGQAMTPMSLQAQAQQLAQTWMMMPEGQRKSEMYNAMKSSPELYALAKTIMEQQQQYEKTQVYHAAKQQGMASGPQMAQQMAAQQQQAPEMMAQQQLQAGVVSGLYSQ